MAGTNAGLLRPPAASLQGQEGRAGAAHNGSCPRGAGRASGLRGVPRASGLSYGSGTNAAIQCPAIPTRSADPEAELRQRAEGKADRSLAGPALHRDTQHTFPWPRQPRHGSHSLAPCQRYALRGAGAARATARGTARSGET